MSERDDGPPIDPQHDAPSGDPEWDALVRACRELVERSQGERLPVPLQPDSPAEATRPGELPPNDPTELAADEPPEPPPPAAEAGDEEDPFDRLRAELRRMDEPPRRRSWWPWRRRDG